LKNATPDARRGAPRIIAPAAAEPTALHTATEDFAAREFKRTASRLIGMGSDSCLALPHGGRISTAKSSAEGVTET
jgi:cell division protein ZapE